MDKKYFAGIGSRSAPESYKEIVRKIAPFLVKKGYVLRSGGATGADSFWEQSYDEANGEKEIWLPWLGFNDNKSKLLWKQADWDLAKEFHPNWDGLKLGARQLMARNTCQCGINNKPLSEFIIAWTEGGEMVGGTAQCLRLAKHFKIPVYNLGAKNGLDKLRKFCKTL